MTGILRDPRQRVFLNPEGADKPLKSPIPHAALVRARGHRKRRLVEQVQASDCAGILLYDPCHIRFAIDVSNMNVWMLHNASHYAFVGADGHAIAFEYRRSEHLAKGYETVDEIRTARTWFYMTAGDTQEERLALWADEIRDVLRERGGGNMRLAVDKLELPGVDALRRRGVTLVEGQALVERARTVKSAEEVALMRWAVRVCEAGMARVYEASLPGKTENEIWAELHYENARSGGEWLETRLLAAGLRTNPWFQESSDYVCQEGDMLAFDTDLIGPYGYCADLSRSWTIGHVPMTDQQRDYYAAAVDQLAHNLAIIRPGMDFREFNEKSWRIPERYQPRRYTVAFHGVGIGDEWPSIPSHVDFVRPTSGRFLEHMTVCLESLIGEEGGRECVKLETQVLVTATGAERLDRFPFEEI